MLSFHLCLCFAIHVATAFSASETLFSDDNDQSLSASLFTSEDSNPANSINLSAQPGNLNPTDSFLSSTEFGNTDPFDADPTHIDSSLVPAGSQDIFDFNSGGDLQNFADDSIFSENLIAANDCGLDSSQVQGRVRARGATCSNTTPGNGVPGSSPQKSTPPEGNNEEPEPLAGGNVNDWHRTCKLNVYEEIMVCSSGNPGDDTDQRLPITDEDFVSLDYSSASALFRPP